MDTKNVLLFLGAGVSVQFGKPTTSGFKDFLESKYTDFTPNPQVALIVDLVENQNLKDAEERYRMNMPDGQAGHAELKIGDSVLMLADEFPEMKSLSPKSIGGSPVSMYVYVQDVDAMFNNAVTAGAVVLD